MKQKLYLISIAALVLCVGSAIYANSVSVTDSSGHPDWSNFGKSVWITILVTLPSFCIFLTAAIKAVLKTIRK
jgi:hypothetical protein